MKKNLHNRVRALCGVVLACCALTLTSCDRDTDDPQPQTITTYTTRDNQRHLTGILTVSYEYAISQL